MNRAEALKHVSEIINGPRNETHGEDAVDTLTHIQMIKRAIGHHECAHLTLAEIEVLDSFAIKIARMVKGKSALEHWFDLIGYAAIGVEARSGADVVKPAIPVTSIGDLQNAVKKNA